MADRVIYATYDDDHTLLEGAKKLVADGVHISDVFSPFPIHGIDPVIGVKHTRLGIVAMMFAVTGMMLAVIGFQYIMISDWPMNIGGKPNFSLLQNFPSFVPITFEFTVLFAAHGMALTYLLRNKTLPGMPADNPYPRNTDDRFTMEIRLSENGGMSSDDLHAKIKQTGIVEIEEKDYVVIK
ncbi:DUF3341 domain-containing protein [Paracrocinitomix mangrovi]|uniref:DUF3341 domain-containing protein n=1 Tax=Paracrocinitomix mangrovi TaxID=2862509 RepID=UPI001C8EABB7|nr:DUF3341 domain-containing protein [Paracrocinitomix mangrovi]UKN00872.1 DUF3341 domain-containing protein [Paracrocinitomix mangrovi]